MGKGPEQTFILKIYTNCQKVHEKVCNIITRQGNGNQSHRYITTVRKTLYQKKKRVNTGEAVEKRESLCVVGWI